MDLFALIKPKPPCFYGMTAEQLKQELNRLDECINNPSENKLDREVARTKKDYIEIYLKLGRYKKESC